MPVGTLKNHLYRAALPLFGKRTPWKSVHCSHNNCGAVQPLHRLLKRHHVVGTAIQIIRGGVLAECYTAGNARLSPAPVPVQPDTLFRTASVAKLAAALLVFRLQTLTLLDVNEPVSDALGYPVCHPRYPNLPITLGMLLSHSSSIVDSAAYFSAFDQGTPLKTLLNDPGAFSGNKPGTNFQYSNLAAGMIGCFLEARFQLSFEALAQKYLFSPLGIGTTFDLSTLSAACVADSYRVLPPGQSPAFDASRRTQSAISLAEPNPETHYLLASGNLFITAQGMGRLLLPCMPSDYADSFLDQRSLVQMKTSLGQWPQQAVPMHHGMGLLKIDDPSVSSHTLYGHQGFAYGAVNGCFFTENGDGFASLNSGASEARLGHISLLNRDLIRLFLS